MQSRQESPLHLDEGGESNDFPQEIRQEIAVADEKNPIVTTTHPEIKDFFAFCKIEPEIAQKPVFSGSAYRKEFVVSLSFNQELRIEPLKKTIQLYQNKKCISEATTPYQLQGITVIDENQFAIVGRTEHKPYVYTIDIWERTPENKLTFKQTLGSFVDRVHMSNQLHAINTSYLIYRGNRNSLLIHTQTKQFIRLPFTFSQQWEYDIQDLYPLIDGQTFYCILSSSNRVYPYLHALLIQEDTSIKLYLIREAHTFAELYLLQNGRVGNLEEDAVTRRWGLIEGKAYVTEFAHIKAFQAEITNLIKELFTNQTHLFAPLIKIITDYLNADVSLTQSEKTRVNQTIPNPMTFFKNKKPIDAIELKDTSVRLLKSEQPTSSCCIVS